MEENNDVLFSVKEYKMDQILNEINITNINEMKPLFCIHKAYPSGA